jgi:predicted nuclease of predicted toxin-antitoxin system
MVGTRVMEVDLSRAEDEEILEFARKNGRVCVTLDHDFHMHLALAGADAASVVLVRMDRDSIRFSRRI